MQHTTGCAFHVIVWNLKPGEGASQVAFWGAFRTAFRSVTLISNTSPRWFGLLQLMINFMCLNLDSPPVIFRLWHDFSDGVCCCVLHISLVRTYYQTFSFIISPFCTAVQRCHYLKPPPLILRITLVTSCAPSKLVRRISKKLLVFMYSYWGRLLQYLLIFKTSIELYISAYPGHGGELTIISRK